MTLSEAMVTPAVAATAAEAEALIAHFSQVMEALLAIVQQETDLVRAGRLGQAALLAEPKADLTRRYIAAALQLKASQALAAPERVAALHRQHDQFRALLQINLTVLATAHAVSEGIVRGVSGELARKSAPSTYGSSGRTAASAASAVQPLAVSRML
jgi:hypothetical protein